MIRRRDLAAGAALLLLARGGRAACAPEHPDMAAEMRASLARFRQEVRVGDLARRYVIGPSESQPVWGVMAHNPILRRDDGMLLAAIDRGGFLGFGTTRVAVPTAALALLGEHVALVGEGHAAFARLPPIEPSAGLALPADATIRMAIVGPFH